MFNVSSKSIKPCNKLMRIDDHSHLQVFFYQTFFLYVVFQSSIRSAFQVFLKTCEIELLQKYTTDLAALEDNSISSI